MGHKLAVGCLTVFLILAALAAIFSGLLVYASEYRVTEIDREASPGGQYIAVFQMIGEPKWPFGPVKGRVIIRRADGQTISKETHTIFNDGAGLHESGWTLEWRADSVKITLNGGESEDIVYSVPLK